MVLEVKNLHAYYSTRGGDVKAVNGINFILKKGEIIGLVGESGCGKTTAALSILRLLPQGGQIVDGEIIFKDTNLMDLSDKEFNDIRWNGISLISQGAMNALNPLLTIGEQMIEGIIRHTDMTKKEALEKSKGLFELVGIDPERIMNYPHEFSGGMKQRAVIAMALGCDPDIIIADEPTTALDVIVQAQILKLIKDLKDQFQTSMILITHDLSVVAEIADKVAIMYAGEIVESGTVEHIFYNPLHPYTQGLIHAFPSIKQSEFEVVSIHGSPPNLINPPKGCKFHPRCSELSIECKNKIPLLFEAEPGNGSHYPQISLNLC